MISSTKFQYLLITSRTFIVLYKTAVNLDVFGNILADDFQEKACLYASRKSRLGK